MQSDKWSLEKIREKEGSLHFPNEQLSLSIILNNFFFELLLNNCSEPTKCLHNDFQRVSNEVERTHQHKKYVYPNIVKREFL